MSSALSIVINDLISSDSEVEIEQHTLSPADVAYLWAPHTSKDYFSIPVSPTVTDYNELIDQPAKILVPLKTHQRASIKRMMEMESTKVKHISPTSMEYTETEQIISLSTSVGFLCDQVGSGKSLTILALLSMNHPIPERDHEIQHHRKFTYYSCLQVRKTMDVRANLIIIPHTIASQWKMYLETQTVNLPFIVICKSKQLPPTSEKATEMFMSHDVIVVTNTFYHHLRPLMTHVRFQRVIIDEADVIHIKKQGSHDIVDSRFVWLITASIRNLFGYFANRAVYHEMPFSERMKYRYFHAHSNSATFTSKMVQDANFQLATFRKSLIVFNDPESIRLSMMIPNYELKVIRLRNNAMINAVKGLVNAEVMAMIHGGDIDNAVKSMQMGEHTTTGLLDAVSTNFQMTLENLQSEMHMCETYHYATPGSREEAVQRVQKKIDKVKQDMEELRLRLEDTEMCAICYDEIVERTILTCCHKSYCLVCISQCLSRNAQCPYCRSKVNAGDMIHVNDKMEEDLQVEAKAVFASFEEELQSLKSKAEVILRIMNHNPMNEKRKFVIASLYDRSFGAVLSQLADHHIHHDVLTGCGAHIANVLSRCRQSDENHVIFLNTNHMGYGLNLEFGTDLILCHRFTGDARNQVIGRLQRFGRQQPLRIWEIMFENELV